MTWLFCEPLIPTELESKNNPLSVMALPVSASNPIAPYIFPLIFKSAISDLPATLETEL